MMDKPPQDLIEQWKKEQEDLKDVQQLPTGPDEEVDPLGIKASYEEQVQSSSVYEKTVEEMQNKKESAE